MVICLKTVDIKPRTHVQQIQHAYNIYAILYSFYNKRTFSKIWRNGPKTIENEEISLSVPQGTLVCVWENFRLRRLRILFSL